MLWIILLFILCLLIVTAVLTMYIISLNNKMINLNIKSEKELKELKNCYDDEKKELIRIYNMELKQTVSDMQVKFDEEKKLELLKHSGEITALKKECDEQIHQMKEYIESQKDILSQMSEKELLINIMMSLSGYSGRFERLESDLCSEYIIDRISNMKQDIVRDIDDYIRVSNEHYNRIYQSLLYKYKTINEQISSNSNLLTSEIDKVRNKLIQDIEEMMSVISNKINESSIISQLSDMNINIRKIQSTHNDLILEIRDIKSITDKIDYDSLFSKVDYIYSDLDSIKSDIAEIKMYTSDGNSYNSLVNEMSSLSSSFSDMQSDIVDIKISVSDKYSYDTLASNLSSISSDLSDIQSNINSIMYAVEDAKNAAESARDSIQSNY